MISTVKASLRIWPIHVWVALFLVITCLAVPISSTAKSISIVVSMGLILLAPAYRRDLHAVISQPWCKAAFFLCLTAVLACIWSPATWSEKFLVLEKYSKLLYLPLLAVGFRDARVRRAGLHAFLLAMAVTCFISMLKFYHVIQYGTGIRMADAGDVFRNHVMTSYMMAFAAYLSCLFFLQQRGLSRIFYAVLSLFLTYQVLFINTGRTGYVIYLLLMMLLLWQQFSWRQSVGLLLVFCSLFAISLYESPVMQEGIKHAVQDLKRYDQNEKDTNIGYRLQFHDYAFSLFKRHPVFGNGTASFTHLFRIDAPVHEWSRTLLEPHSQYWLTASEFGVLGIIGLLCFFGSLFLTCFRLREMRYIAIAMMLSFLVGNLSDSLLFYSGTGYFFIVFMALCLGEQVEFKT